MLFAKAAKAVALSLIFLPITGCAIVTGIIFASVLKSVSYLPDSNDLLSYTSELTTSILSLQKVNYISLHLVSAARWVKVRVSYALNNWVYTTNHKRIVINYFNFVLVSVTAGMSLATVIRMKFTYPGVGILVGDSTQYLCIATAHGFIMVFFMVMPAIFGAFGNFILPTQLNVHDVTSTRLSSAAFWFLPGGLIMLCQLVCVDRRYRRTNCFNIRELQGILKRKFFTDLVSTGESVTNTGPTLVGTEGINTAPNTPLYNQSLFLNFTLTNTPKYKYSTYNSCLSGGCRPYTQSVTSLIQLKSRLSALKQVMLIIGLTAYYLSTSGLYVVNECCGYCCCFNNTDYNSTPSSDPYSHDHQEHADILSSRNHSPKNRICKTHSPKTVYTGLIGTPQISPPPIIEEVKSDPQSSHDYNSQQSFRANNPSNDCQSAYLLYKDNQVRNNEEIRGRGWHYTGSNKV